MGRKRRMPIGVIEESDHYGRPVWLTRDRYSKWPLMFDSREAALEALKRAIGWPARPIEPLKPYKGWEARVVADPESRVLWRLYRDGKPTPFRIRLAFYTKWIRGGLLEGFGVLLTKGNKRVGHVVGGSPRTHNLHQGWTMVGQVSKAHLEDSLHNQGLGGLMYRAYAALLDAWHPSGEPTAIAPMMWGLGTGTSFDAQRAWRSLERAGAERLGPTKDGFNPLAGVGRLNQGVRWRANGDGFRLEHGGFYWSLSQSSMTRQWQLYQIQGSCRGPVVAFWDSPIGVKKDSRGRYRIPARQDSRRWSAARAKKWARTHIDQVAGGSANRDPRWRDEGQVGSHWGSSGSGVLLVDPAGHALILRRSAVVHTPAVWSIPGGARPVDRQTGERRPARESAFAEAREEAGFRFSPRRHQVLGEFELTFPDGFVYTTIVVRVPARFTPTLNRESAGSGWVPLQGLPSWNLHPGFRAFLDQVGVDKLVHMATGRPARSGPVFVETGDLEFDDFDGITLFDAGEEVDLAYLLAVARSPSRSTVAELSPADVAEIQHSIDVYDAHDIPAVRTLMQRMGVGSHTDDGRANRSYPWLPLATVRRFEQLMEARDVSKVARSDRGFLTAWKRAGGDAGRLGANPTNDRPWVLERDGFIARHEAQRASGLEPLYEPKGKWRGTPTRRHLGMIAWGYSPDGDAVLESLR